MIGLLVLLGCGTCPGDFECSPPVAVPAATLQIESAGRGDVVAGTVALDGEDTVTLDYVDDRGRAVRVTYARVR